MLYYTLMFLVVGLIAGGLGLFGIAAIAGQIAWVLFLIGVILIVVHMISGRRASLTRSRRGRELRDVGRWFLPVPCPRALCRHAVADGPSSDWRPHRCGFMPPSRARSKSRGMRSTCRSETLLRRMGSGA
jgi:uncharacterized membrane protein YtjA (UPF0391 family)